MGPSEEVITFPIPLENRGRFSLQNGVVFSATEDGPFPKFHSQLWPYTIIKIIKGLIKTKPCLELEYLMLYDPGNWNNTVK